MVYAGYAASVLVGISLGLLGSGGSILMMPVLVYLFHLAPVPAASYSLFIVGITSTTGAARYLTQGLIHLKTTLFFGIPSVGSVFLTRAWLVTAIPEHLFTIGGLIVSKSMLLLLLFGVLLIAASYSMIRKDRQHKDQPGRPVTVRYGLIAAGGMLAGLLAGLLGAGGGFLIIPMLLLLGRLEIKAAIGSSLVIIAVNSAVGFLSGGKQMTVDWSLLLTLTAFATGGMLIGIALSRRIDGRKLKPVFGWFILVLGICIIVKELW